MELKMRGMVKDGPDGTLVLEFGAAPNAGEVSTFLRENLGGREFEVTLKPAEDEAGASRHAAKGKEPGTFKREGLSYCASGAYWRTKDDKGK